MPRPLLPPRGVFVPTRLIFQRKLTPSVVLTWLQLRALAWGQHDTPEISLQQVQELTGKSPSTLYGHMALLRSWDALRWRPSEGGTLIVTFDLDDLPDSAFTVERAQFQDSRTLENLSPSPSSSKFNILEEELREARLRDSGIRESETGDHVPAGSDEAERAGGRPTEPSPFRNAIAAYQRITGRHPNSQQRQQIASTVADLNLWVATLRHWKSHRWKPGNVPGMLDLFQRGGPDQCHYCRPDSPPPNRDRSRPATFDALDELRKEIDHGEAGSDPGRA